MNRVAWSLPCLLAALALGLALASGAARAAAPGDCAAWAAQHPSGATAMPMPGAMGMAKDGSGDMPGMFMLDASSAPMPLVCLTAHDPSPPPLYTGIGAATRPVPGGPVVQDYFNQGLRFYYAFNNRESYRAFRYAIQRQDPAAPCAICYVGEALALGVDINMSTELEPDRLAAKQALALATEALKRDIQSGKVPEREAQIIAILISGLELRFQDCPSPADTCQATRNTAYEQWLERWIGYYGGDPDFVVLFADSVMNLTPWGYWNRDGSAKLPAVNTARAKIEAGMKLHPQHEGLPHWYIHLMEMSGNPAAAKGAADGLAAMAPNAGHLVHMPSHIYYRLGDMKAAIAANRAAIATDTRYFNAARLSHPDGDRYRFGYYPHNIHFLLAAASMRGDGRTVDEAAQLLLAAAPDQGTGYRADRYRAVYYLGRTSFASAPDIRGYPKPLPNQPLAQVAYDYTQVWASVLERNGARAQSDNAKLQADAKAYRDSAPAEPNRICSPKLRLPADLNLCLVTIMTDLAAARINTLAGRGWSEIAQPMMEAIAIQDLEPYDEPPPWLYPLRQTLAGLVLTRQARGQSSPTELIIAYKEIQQALPQADTAGRPLGSGVFPGNGWAYYALWKLHTLLDPSSRHEDEERRFRANWDGAAEPDPAHM